MTVRLGFLGLNDAQFSDEALDQSMPPCRYVQPSYEPLAPAAAPRSPEPEGMTRAEVAAALGLSRERVRQIEAKALRKLAQAFQALERRHTKPPCVR